MLADDAFDKYMAENLGHALEVIAPSRLSTAAWSDPRTGLSRLRHRRRRPFSPWALSFCVTKNAVVCNSDAVKKRQAAGRARYDPNRLTTPHHDSLRSMPFRRSSMEKATFASPTSTVYLPSPGRVTGAENMY
jgi:hypothetical protein